jgi:squalene-associated FAD-dependent desaturase
MLPARPTQSERAPGAPGSGPTVAVVGGGLAGLAAACALAESGFRVTLVERRPYLGGRASSYEHPGTGEVLDNCQHVLFGCCTNLIAFYKEIGIEERIRWFDRMTFIEPGGRRSRLEATALPAPLHVAPSFLGLKFLSAWDKVVLSEALVSLISGKMSDDGSSFQSWLERHHQTHNAIERFWKPIMVSALSEDLDRIAIPYAAQVVRESMKSRNARRMGIPMVPLSQLYNPARDYITGRKGSVRLRNRVQSLLSVDDGVRLKLEDSEEEFDFAVVAVAFDALAKLLPDSAESRDLRESLSQIEGSPITGVHFWFDRQISELPHAILLERTIQWMFHKSLLLGNNLSPGVRHGQADATVNDPAGESAYARAQNLSAGRGILQRENRGEPAKNGTGTPSYIELIVSSAKSLLEKSRAEIIDLALTQLREFFPAARDAKLLKAAVIKEVNATFSPKPDIDRYRPPQQSPWPRIFLAGDWTRTGWPATMEGAVRSGYLAAEAVTKSCGPVKRFLVPDLLPEGLMRIIG